MLEFGFAPTAYSWVPVENPSSYEEKTLSPTLEKKEVLKRKERGVCVGFFCAGDFKRRTKPNTRQKAKGKP